MKRTHENLVLASGTRKTWIYIQYAIKGFLPKKEKKSPCFLFAPLVRGTPCSRSGIPKKRRIGHGMEGVLDMEGKSQIYVVLDPFLYSS